jgi:Fe-S cluster assembly scaffold protein SufB
MPRRVVEREVIVSDSEESVELPPPKTAKPPQRRVKREKTPEEIQQTETNKALRTARATQAHIEKAEQKRVDALVKQRLVQEQQQREELEAQRVSFTNTVKDIVHSILNTTPTPTNTPKPSPKPRRVKKEHTEPIQRQTAVVELDIPKQYRNLFM